MHKEGARVCLSYKYNCWKILTSKMTATPSQARIGLAVCATLNTIPGCVLCSQPCGTSTATEISHGCWGVGRQRPSNYTIQDDADPQRASGLTASVFSELGMTPPFHLSPSDDHRPGRGVPHTTMWQKGRHTSWSKLSKCAWNFKGNVSSETKLKLVK